jgi:hypothetical protein
MQKSPINIAFLYFLYFDIVHEPFQLVDLGRRVGKKPGNIGHLVILPFVLIECVYFQVFLVRSENALWVVGVADVVCEFGIL